MLLKFKFAFVILIHFVFTKTIFAQESPIDEACRYREELDLNNLPTGYFDGDTIVYTPNGNTKISDLRPGDLVYSWSQKQTKLLESKVTRTSSVESVTCELSLNTQTSFRVTPDQLFYVVKDNTVDKSKKAFIGRHTLGLRGTPIGDLGTASTVFPLPNLKNSFIQLNNANEKGDIGMSMVKLTSFRHPKTQIVYAIDIENSFTFFANGILALGIITR